MKKIIFQVRLVLAIFSLALLMPMGLYAKDYSKKYLQDVYIKILKSEGYRPKIDNDGDVRFKKEGSTYYFSIDEDDSDFLRLVLTNIYEIDGEKDAEKLGQIFKIL